MGEPRVNLTSNLLHPKPDRWWVGRNKTVALLPLRKMLLSSPLSKLVKCPSPKLKLRTEVGVIKLWRYYPFQQHHHSEQCKRHVQVGRVHSHGNSPRQSNVIMHKFQDMALQHNQCTKILEDLMLHYVTQAQDSSTYK